MEKYSNTVLKFSSLESEEKQEEYGPSPLELNVLLQLKLQGYWGKSGKLMKKNRFNVLNSLLEKGYIDKNVNLTKKGVAAVDKEHSQKYNTDKPEKELGISTSFAKQKTQDDIIRVDDRVIVKGKNSKTENQINNYKEAENFVNELINDFRGLVEIKKTKTKNSEGETDALMLKVKSNSDTRNKIGRAWSYGDMFYYDNAKDEEGFYTDPLSRSRNYSMAEETRRNLVKEVITNLDPYLSVRLHGASINNIEKLANKYELDQSNPLYKEIFDYARKKIEVAREDLTKYAKIEVAKTENDTLNKSYITPNGEHYSSVIEKVGRSYHYVYEWIDCPEDIKKITSNRLRSKTQIGLNEIIAWISELSTLAITNKI